MSYEYLAHIKLESAEYHKLSLGDKVRVFNREVHEYETEQYNKILQLWKKVHDDYIKTGSLTEEKEHALKHSFSQAMENLTAMQQAKTLYEADLYRKSYLAALERVAPTRRHKFISLQKESIVLAHDAKDVQARIQSVKKELNILKEEYGVTHQDLFRRAERELIELSQIKDPVMFAHKRRQYLNTLADIHESANAITEAQRCCYEHVEEAKSRGQALFDAKSSYLEDKNHWMNRATDIAEKSWVGVGTGLAVVPVGLLVAGAVVGAAVLAPAAAVVGIAAAAYGIVDLARTTATTITREVTPKLGDKSFQQPELSTWQKFKKVAKKAAPVGLCLVGAAIAMTAVVLTGGVAAIALAGAGLAVAAIGVGVMVKDKYDEYQEVREIRANHKEINEKFDSEIDAKNASELHPQPSKQEALSDSTEEAMTILAGHELTKADVNAMETEIQQLKSKEASIKQTEDSKPNTLKAEQKEKAEVKSSGDEDDDEEGDSGSDNESDEAAILKP